MNHYGKRTILAFLFVALGLSSRSAFSAIIIHKGGLWPQTWPRELEPLRKDAVTIDVATGRPEVIYEIRFKDRSTFERAWPLLCQLRSEGAPLRLYRVGSPLRKGWDQVLSNNLPTVRIRTPVTEPVREPESNKSVGAAAPSPALSAIAQLPEYREEGPLKERLRTEIELVVDGTVIDLNRIPFPVNSPIIDNRWPSEEPDGAVGKRPALRQE